MSASDEGSPLVRDGRLRPAKDDAARADAFVPCPVPQSHAANLTRLRNGDIACVWFAGTQEGLPDVSIYMAKLRNGADAWSAPVKLSDDPTRSEQNPVLFAAPDGRLWLLYTAQVLGNQNTAIVRYRISDDNGETWGPIGSLFDEEGIFIRQPLVVLENGDWLMPIFLCRTLPGEKWTGSRDTSAVRISSDGGRTWSHHDVPDSVGCVHMNPVRLGDGSLIAFFRSRWADNIYISRSDGSGRRWSPPVPTALPNNNSSIQTARLRDGRLALVYNDKSAADSADRRRSLYDEIEDDSPEGSAAAIVEPGRTALWGIPRAPLTLAFSEDQGRTWRKRNIELGDGRCLSNESKEERRNRELSYPTVMQTDDGTLHVAFTYFRQAIKYVRLPENWADLGP